MTIDAHQHFWEYHPKRHAWIDKTMEAIQRDFLPSDLTRVYKQLNIEGCVAVQVDQTKEETTFLLALAEQHDFIRGVVGWVDLGAPILERQLEYYKDYPKLCGFRHIVQSEADPLFLLRDKFLKGISKLAQYGYTYDILIFPHQLGTALELVKLFPNQKFIIDHIAKPYIKAGFIEAWAVQMKAIAKYENVYCKVSGMVTEADWGNWKYHDFVPYLDIVFEAFGIQRVVYGSDWPVCLVAASYHQMKGIVDTYLSQFSSSDQKLFFRENALRFYDLN